jgi:sugar/nucleoside kinase (ribokinase family)
MSVAVITKLNPQDTHLTENLKKENIPVFEGRSVKTTTFKNVNSNDTDTRKQWIGDVATPFTVNDVSQFDARVFHLGPLTKEDISLNVIRFLADRAKISLDVQGFLREFEKGNRDWAQVSLSGWKEMRAVLPFVNIVKCNEEEAKVLSDEQDLVKIATKLSSIGPEEVIITRGSKDSLVYSKDTTYWVRAYPPRNAIEIDPTGCGDTYMAGYLFYRTRSTKLDEVAKFAAMTASVKLELNGPFTGKERDVKDFANAVGQPFSSKA